MFHRLLFFQTSGLMIYCKKKLDSSENSYNFAFPYENKFLLFEPHSTLTGSSL